MKIMGQALENAKLYFDGKVVCATITSAEIAACNGTNKELDAIINYLKGVQGQKWHVSFTKRQKQKSKQASVALMAEMSAHWRRNSAAAVM